ncbi:hypothetical protein ALTERO38_51450 [Alteromonas sp. 38]|nr:hypothetical protein ALTER154_70634 [Alteromonas sp. 154]VXB73749.1 hypothetical protein ALTERO38_51450 [Alteromonas sp. 38]
MQALPSYLERQLATATDSGQASFQNYSRIQPGKWALVGDTNGR